MSAITLNLAYMAGFFDGEGCIFARIGNTTNGQGKKYPAFWISVKINQIVEEPLLLFRDRFGGIVRKVPYNGKDNRKHRIYEWECQHSRMLEFLQCMLPFATTKRPEITVGIEFLKTIGNKGQPVSTETWNKRKHLQQKLKELKASVRELI